MNGILDQYIGTKCVITNMGSSYESIYGVVTAITDEWLFVKVDNCDIPEAVKLDYITSIKPYPTKKKK